MAEIRDWRESTLYKEAQPPDAGALGLLNQKLIGDQAESENYYFEWLMAESQKILREDFEGKRQPRKVRELLCYKHPGLKDAAFGRTPSQKVRGAIEFEQGRQDCTFKEAYAAVQRHMPFTMKLFSGRKGRYE